MRIINTKLKVVYTTKSKSDDYIINYCVYVYNNYKKESIFLAAKMSVLVRYNKNYKLIDDNEEIPDDYTIITGKTKNTLINKINKDFNLEKIIKEMDKDEQLMSIIKTEKIIKQPLLSNYKEYLKTKEWIEIRNRIYKRDNNKCVICDSKLNLNCHHISYENIYNEKDEDLITLCNICHNNEHNKINAMELSVNDYYKLINNYYWNNLKKQIKIEREAMYLFDNVYDYYGEIYYKINGEYKLK